MTSERGLGPRPLALLGLGSQCDLGTAQGAHLAVPIGQLLGSRKSWFGTAPSIFQVSLGKPVCTAFAFFS